MRWQSGEKKEPNPITMMMMMILTMRNSSRSRILLSRSKYVKEFKKS